MHRWADAGIAGITYSPSIVGIPACYPRSLTSVNVIPEAPSCIAGIDGTAGVAGITGAIGIDDAIPAGIASIAGIADTASIVGSVPRLPNN